MDIMSHDEVVSRLEGAPHMRKRIGLVTAELIRLVGEHIHDPESSTRPAFFVFGGIEKWSIRGWSPHFAHNNQRGFYLYYAENHIVYSSKVQKQRGADDLGLALLGSCYDDLPLFTIGMLREFPFIEEALRKLPHKQL